LGKTLLYCDIAESKPDNQSRTVDHFLYQFNILKSRTEAWGQAIGLSIHTTLIPNGIRMEAEATTPEGKERIWSISGTTITKIVLEIRRVGPVEVVSVILNYPGVPDDSPLLLMPFKPNPEQAAEFTYGVERAIGAPHGACHLF
jgi:hypothetical protein